MKHKAKFIALRSHRPIAAALTLLVILQAAIPARALPTDYSVEAGDVTSEVSGSEQRFNINSDQAILNFSEFSIAPTETVSFHFNTANPSASSILNRVTGGGVSTLAGVLLSNGQVFLINPAGIHIMDTARIETAGFIASTLNIGSEDFLGQNYRFIRGEGDLPGQVINQGRILAGPGDLVALLGGNVQNTGYIVAEMGKVALAAGDQITLTFDRSGTFAVAVVDPLTQVARATDGQLVDSAIQQSGLISAAGGHVLIQARAVEGLFNRLITLPSGIVEAVTVVMRNGRIELIGEGGAVLVGGRLSANAGEGEKAGSVQVTGDDVQLKAGSILEAKATGEVGEGGSVKITSTHPKESGTVDFEAGAKIHADGGSVSGDAGAIELSAAEVKFDGQATAKAGTGSRGGNLLVDPLFVIFNNTVRAAPANNPDGTPDVAFGDEPAAGTTFIFIASIIGFAEAFFQAVNDITVNRDIVMDAGNSLRLESGRDTFLNASVTTSGAGKITMTADADFSAAGGAASDGIGSIVLAAAESLTTDSGDMTLKAGGDITMGAGASLNSGSGKIDLQSGGKMDLQEITSASGDIQSKAGTDWTAFADVTTGGAGKISTETTSGILVVKESLITDTGAIELNSGDRTDVIRVASTSGDIKMTSGADILIQDSAVTGGAGGLFLKADDTIELDDFFEAIVRTTGTGAISLEAGLDGTGQVTMGPAFAEILSNSGNVTITSPGPMDLRRVASTSGNVTVDSGDLMTVRHSLITGGAGTVSAESDDAMTFEAGALARTTGTGNLTINAGADGTGDLTAAAGSTIQTATGNVTIDSTGDMILDRVQSTSGVVDIDSTKAVTLNNRVNTAGAGTIGVEAGNALTVAAGGSADTTAGEITMASGGLMTVSGPVKTTGGNITLEGNNGIHLNSTNSDITTAGGAFTGNADADNNLSGLFSQTDAGSVISTSGGEVAISGEKVDLDGVVRSGAGKLTLTATGGLMTIANILETLGSDILINGANGIQLDGPTNITTSGGKFTANADSDSNLTGDFSQTDPLSVINTAGGEVAISGDKINLDGTVRSGAGKLTVTATGGLMTISNTLVTTAGEMLLSGVNGIFLDGATNIATAGGKLTINADSNSDNIGDFNQSDALSVVNSGAGDLTVTGDKVDVDGTLRTSTGKLSVTSPSNYVAISGVLMTTLGEIVVNAAQNLLLDSAVSSITTDGGKITLTADTDSNGFGDYIQNMLGGKVNSSGADLTVSGRRVFLTDAALETEGGKMALNGANGITAAGATSLLTQGGDLTANADANLDNDGDFDQTGAASLINSEAGKLSITGKRVNTDGLVRSTTGDIEITSPDSFITVSNKISTEGGKLSLLAGNGITFDHADADVTTGGGEFLANANTNDDNSGTFLQSDAGSVITTSGGKLTVTARDMDLQGDLRSGAGEMDLTATHGSITAAHLLETTGSSMDLLAAHGITLAGATVRTNGGVFTGNSNSDADDDGDFFQTGIASIINTAGGPLSISGRTVGLEGTLRGGAGDIDATATFGSLTSSHEILTAGGQVDLNAGNGLTLHTVRTEGGALAADANTNADEQGDFAQTAGGVINTGAGSVTASGFRVNTAGSIDTTTSDVNLTATHRSMEIGGAITTVGGNVNLMAADDITLNSSAADILTNGGAFTADANTDGDDDGEFDTVSGSLIDTAGGALSITADDFNTSGDLRSFAGTTSLLASRPGSEIYLGNAVRVNGQINISQGEADRIIADTLVIGSDAAGNMTIGSFAPPTVNTLVLRTGGSVGEEGPADVLSDLAVANLGIHSVSGVNLDVDVTNLAILNNGVGAIHVEDMAGGMSVGTVAGINGVSTLGGGVTLLTNSPLIIDAPVSDLGGGDIALAAFGSSESDDLSIHADVTASGGNGNILLAAGDSVSIDPGVTVSAENTGGVAVFSGENLKDGVLNDDGNPAGTVFMGEDSSVLSEDGNIFLSVLAGFLPGVLNANSNGDAAAGTVTIRIRNLNVNDGFSPIPTSLFFSLFSLDPERLRKVFTG